MKMRRRTFLQGCCSGIAALAGTRLGNLSFGQNPGQRDVIISVFLRGGLDALSLLAPFDDSEYHAARPDLGLAGANVFDLDGYFGLNIAAERLRDLYNAGHLALIPACGFPDSNRSHFEAQDIMDRGVTGYAAQGGDGWLARHLAPAAPMESVFRAVSLGSSLSTSLEGYNGGLSMNSAGDFTLNTHWNHVDDARVALRQMYAGDPRLSGLAERTLDAMDIVDSNPPGNYTPGNNVTYPNTNFSNALRSLAQIIRMQVGLEAATVDLGGWDTHENQASGSNPAEGYFANLVREMSEGLHAFWSDLQDQHGRLTIVIMSEFGRRVRENNSRGTDHGHGGLMGVISANVREKKIYGTWPGLAQGQLFESVDVQMTTDFRTVIAEVLRARRGVSPTEIAALFPDFSFGAPVGFFLDPGAPTAASDWSLFQ